MTFSQHFCTHISYFSSHSTFLFSPIRELYCFCYSVLDLALSPICHVFLVEWRWNWQPEPRKPGSRPAGWCRWWTGFFVASRTGKCHRRKSSSLHRRELKLKAGQCWQEARLPEDCR